MLSNGSEYHTVDVEPSEALLGDEPEALLLAVALEAEVKYVLLLRGAYGVVVGVRTWVVTVADQALTALVSLIPAQYVAALHLYDSPLFKPLNVTERVVLLSPVKLAESNCESGEAGSHPNPVSSSR